MQGRLDEALAEGKRAAELDPLSPQILVDAIYALAWQSKYPAAMDQANRSLQLDPSFFWGHFARGWIDIAAAKINSAVPELQKADAIGSPSFVAGWLG